MKRSNKKANAGQPEEFPKAPYPHQNSLTSPINEERKQGTRNVQVEEPQELLTWLAWQEVKTGARGAFFKQDSGRSEAAMTLKKTILHHRDRPLGEPAVYK